MKWTDLGRLAIVAGFFITLTSFVVNGEEKKWSAPSGKAVYEYGHTIYMGDVSTSRASAYLAGKSAYVEILAHSIITKFFNNESVYYNLRKASHPMTDQVHPFSFNSTKPMLRDESDVRNKFSFAIDGNKIKLIVNLTSCTSLYAGYQALSITGLGHAYDQLCFQTVPPLFSPTEGLGVLSNKNVLYHGPFVEAKFRW